MTAEQNLGFTIIELILFLALTGLFMLIAFSGIGGRSGQVQFTDSMRSLSSYVQRQYSDTLNGVNVRADSAGCQYNAAGSIVSSGDGPGKSDCVVMGKAMVFKDGSSEADVYVIVGRLLTQTADPSSPNYLDPSLSDADLIASAQPMVLLSTLNQSYEMEWQSKFIDSGSDYNTLAYIRSPRSSNIYPITFDSNWSGSSPVPLNTASLSGASSYCFEGANGQDAEIFIGGNNRSDSVELAFDTGCS